MDALGIVLLVAALLLLLLFVGGFLANARRRRAERARLHALTQEADQHLAAAHAADKGWERTGLEQAARQAFLDRTGRAPTDLTLVQVVDRPGTDEDEAVFEGDGERLVLGRRGDAWIAR